MRVLAIIEATTITGPAKNLIRFASLTKNPPSGSASIDLSIVTYRRGKGGPKDEFADRVRGANIGIDLIPERAVFDWSVVGKLQRLASERRPDIIQTHGVKSHFLLRMSGLHERSRWIAFHHGYTNVDAKMRAYNQLDRWSLRKPCRIITVCQPFLEELVRMGVPRARIDVLPNSIEPAFGASQSEIEQVRARYGIRPGELVVLSIGRFSREKGHIELPTAAAEITRSRPDLRLHFLLAGDGPEREQVWKAAASLAHPFTFTGHVADVMPLLGAADVFVLPSYSEGSPNVLLEAMSAGVPIVSTNVGGVPETVQDGWSALLVPPRDPRALAAAILRIVNERDLASRLRANALSAIKLRSPQAYYRSLTAIYEAVSR